MFAKTKGPFARPSLLSRFTRGPRDRERLQPLYRAIVAQARLPIWYRDGQVPDTLDGRFDMLAACMAIVLLRLEAEDGDEPKQAASLVTELFVADMDESLHQIGIGDYVVGKHVGKMMGALGGRLTVFRQAAADGDYQGPVRRNIYHDAPPADAIVALVVGGLERFAVALRSVGLADLIAGKLPTA